MKKWIFVFWFQAILFGYSLFTFPFSNDLDLYGVAALLVQGILLLPYYGYAYEVRLGVAIIWKVVFLFYLSIFLIYFAPSFTRSIHRVISFEGDWALGLIFIPLSIFFTVILFIPPYRYAFKSERLWNATA